MSRFSKIMIIVICFLICHVYVIAQNPINDNLSIGEGKYYALLIGVSEYSDPQLTDLTSPVSNAETLSQILSDKYTFENVKLLRNPEKSEIEAALDNFIKTLNSKDNLLIYFCGLGGWDESSETGYWLSSDSKTGNRNTQINTAVLHDYIRKIKSKHTLLIIDAGFAGSVFRSRSYTRAPGSIKELYDLPGRKAMTSTTLSGDTPDRNVFSKNLFEILNSNKEKYLSSEQLFNSFRISVINNSSVVPQFGALSEAGDEGGDFIFILK